MPTYQYACTNPESRHEFELVQSFTDDPVSDCPECGSAVRKVYGSVGVVFKGSGFYRTDSRNGSGSGSAKKSTEKAGDTASSTGSSTTESTSGSSSSPSSSNTGGTKAAAS